MIKPESSEAMVNLPFIPLRGINVFPEMLMNFDVERKASIEALNAAVSVDHIIFLTAQKDINVDVPGEEDIYKVGTVCRVRQILRQPGGGMCRVMVEGLYRAGFISLDFSGPVYRADVIPLPDKTERISAARLEALSRNLFSLFEEYVQLAPDMLNEQIINVIANPNLDYAVNYISQNVRMSLNDRQLVLSETVRSKRMALLSKLLNHELNIMSLEKELNEATNDAINDNQRDYYLREELKLIQQELGEDDSFDDFSEYRGKIEKLAAPQEIKDRLLKELSRLQKQPFGSSEASVIRSYLDTCLELPWGIRTEEVIDVASARKCLDEDHYGLEKVKERIIEYLSVRQLSPEVKGGLICLVGPPGTGKTSIAMSVARAVNRKLVRISLGGVHDEAEIRGHRKTYVGAMPGRIINGLIQSGSCNPLMVLDEIDKLGSDYRGDPSAALLEVLDSEQNKTFRDNFLEIPFDLSEVFFIMTANTTDTIPRPLLDRMEVIELSSYTDEEKLMIAKQHLLPKQRRKHGLKAAQLKISDDAFRRIASDYTRESGVRLLEREIASICRKTAAGIVAGDFKSANVKPGSLEKYLGPARYNSETKFRGPEVGLVRGLAYTVAGGEILDVEVIVVPGTGKFELTGNLGDVMKESVRAAVSCIRSLSGVLGISPDFYTTKDIHVHFPEGAVPKDGPSAGVTVFTALVSALTGRPVRQDIAMTGEISLRGRVMRIGGLREKTMAALREGVTDVIIPASNLPDLEEIDPLVREKLHFIPVKTVDELVPLALLSSPEEKKTVAGILADIARPIQTGSDSIRQ